MADHQPRVKLPDVIPRKLLAPGPNSWAQSTQHDKHGKGDQVGRSNATNRSKYEESNATNRSKYEDKPMPPTPTSPASIEVLKTPGKRAYIHPAIPIVPQGKMSQGYKNRAATDPVGIAQLRGKASNLQSIQEPEVGTEQNPFSLSITSHDPSAVMNMYPVHNNGRYTPPKSAPPSTHTPDPFCERSGDDIGRSLSPMRQIQSTPVPERPTRRYLRENNLPTPTLPHASPVVIEQTRDEVRVEEQVYGGLQGLILGHGRLSPKKTGTYGRVGEISIMDGPGIKRVASHRGELGNILNDPGSATLVNPYTEGSMALAPGTAYSPSDYGGVWENNPQVGISLPSFNSPVRPHFPQDPDAQGRNISTSSATVPIMFQGRNSEITPTSVYVPSLPSATSWETDLRGNSYSNSNKPLSATVPHLFTNQSTIQTNFVPPPPRSHPEFQPSTGPMPAGLAQLEFALHHHIDTCFGSLSRLVTDKHDKIADQMIRRMENLEETVEQWMKNFKAELGNVKKDVGTLKKEGKETGRQHEGSMQLLKTIEEKLGTLEKKFEEGACKCQFALPTEKTRRESEASSHRKSGNTVGSGVERRGSEGPHAAAISQRQQQHRNGTSNSSAGVRHSGTSGRARRSNTESGSAAGGVTNDMIARRDYFTEMGATLGPEPDLREHPAFSGVQQGHGQAYGQDRNAVPVPMRAGLLDRSPYAVPSFGDGAWYREAYGKSFDGAGS